MIHTSKKTRKKATSRIILKLLLCLERSPAAVWCKMFCACGSANLLKPSLRSCEITIKPPMVPLQFLGKVFCTYSITWAATQSSPRVRPRLQKSASFVSHSCDYQELHRTVCQLHRTVIYFYLSKNEPPTMNTLEASGTLLSMLCCVCGITIQQNPSNMCVSCVRNTVDITEEISKKVTIHSCRTCQR